MEEIREWVRKQIGNKEDSEIIKKALVNRGYDPKIFDEVLEETKEKGIIKPKKILKKICKASYKIKKPVEMAKESSKKIKEIMKRKDEEKRDIKNIGIGRIHQRKLKIKLYKIVKIGVPILVIILLINYGFNVSKDKKIVESKDENEIILQRDSSIVNMINMDGSPEEKKFLAEGFWPSLGSIRWGGNDHKYPTLVFEASKKEHSLETKMLIPKPLINKNIEIIVNGNVIEKFSLNEEQEIVKNVDISSDLVKDKKLNIIFKSDFWNTLDYYPGNALDREQTIAFDYVILREK